MWVCFTAFATGYYLVFIFTVQAYNSPYVADWEGRYVTGLPLSYSQHQTSGMFSSNVWGKSYDLCDIRLSQKMAGELLWGKPISRPAAGIEAKGLVCILAKSKHRSQELQWLRIPLPAPWPNSAFILPLGEASTCLYSVGFPASTCNTHSSRWDPNNEVWRNLQPLIWDLVKLPRRTWLYSHSHPGLFKPGICLILYSGIWFFKKCIYWNNIEYVFIKVNKSK